MADTIRSESDLQEVFKDGQPANSITAQDVRDLVVSSKHLHLMGWEFCLDSAATISSPVTITGGTRHHFTSDGLLAQVIHPTRHTAFWNPSTNKIEPPALNDFIDVRFAFTATSTSGAGSTNQFELELDTTGKPNGTGSPATSGDIIFRQTEFFSKGIGQTQHFNFIMPLFVGAQFLAAGGIFYITPVNDMDIWRKAVIINRVLSAVP